MFQVLEFCKSPKAVSGGSSFSATGSDNGSDNVFELTIKIFGVVILYAVTSLTRAECLLNEPGHNIDDVTELTFTRKFEDLPQVSIGPHHPM